MLWLHFFCCWHSIKERIDCLPQFSTLLYCFQMKPIKAEWSRISHSNSPKLVHVCAAYYNFFSSMKHLSKKFCTTDTHTHTHTHAERAREVYKHHLVLYSEIALQQIINVLKFSLPNIQSLNSMLMWVRCSQDNINAKQYNT